MTKILLNFTLFTGLTLAARGQPYTLDWYQVAGGGGTLTNSRYSLSATAGQPDAGAAMSGGNYSVTGGFWAVAVQTPGAPLLTIKRSGVSSIISWPYPSTGYVLQQNSSLSGTNWINSSFTVSTNSSVNTVTINAAGNLFLRLKK